jgi:hypothetical protein
VRAFLCHIINLYLVVLACVPTLHTHISHEGRGEVHFDWLEDETESHDHSAPGCDHEDQCTVFCFCHIHVILLPGSAPLSFANPLVPARSLPFPAVSDVLHWQDVYGDIWRPPSMA